MAPKFDPGNFHTGVFRYILELLVIPVAPLGVNGLIPIKNTGMADLAFRPLESPEVVLNVLEGPESQFHLRGNPEMKLPDAVFSGSHLVHEWSIVIHLENHSTILELEEGSFVLVEVPLQFSEQLVNQSRRHPHI